MGRFKRSESRQSLVRLLSVLVASALIGVLGSGCSKATRAARYIEKANGYFEAGQFEKAEIEYLNALRLDAGNALVIRRLGAIYFDQGRLRPAFTFLKKAKDINPEDLDNRAKLAAVLNSVGQREKGREELIPILAKEPAHVEAIHFLAETAVTPGDIRETRERLQKLRQQAGEKAVFHVAEGLLCLRETNMTAAEQSFKQAVALDAKMATAYLGLGAIYWRTNDLAGAERMFKTAQELSPTRSPRQLQWVDFKTRTGTGREAKPFLEQLVKKAPDFIPALNRLAELEFADNKTNECSAHISKALALDPENYDARALLGRLRLAQGQPGQAVKEFERLRSLYPGLAQAHYQLALAYLVTQDPGKAIASLQQSLTLNTNLYEAAILLADLKTRQGDAAGAIGLLSDIVKRRPNDERAHYFLANAYRASGRVDDALNVYRGLTRTFPKNPRAFVLIASILRQQNKPTEARKALEDALTVAPNSPAAVAQLVELDLLDNNYAGALQRVQAALEKNPKAAELRFLEAKVHLGRGDTSQAEAALRKSVELAPDFREAYMALAQILIKTKKPDLALEELGKGLVKNPKDTGTLMMMGMLYEAKSDFAKARDTYEKLLGINPQFSPALNNLAYIYAVRFKQVDKGFEIAQKARQLLPNDPATADTMGWITYLRGDYAGALPLLQESVEKLPNEPEVQYHLGMAHYTMGHEELARAALQAAVQSTNEFMGKDEARQKLVVLNGEAGRPVSEIIQALEKSLAQYPNDVALMLRLGPLYEQTGQLRKAQDVSEKALKVNPKAIRALLVLARVYGARPDGAQQAFEYAKSARAAAPEDGEVAHAAGRAAFQAGQHDWAYNILQESNRKLTDDPEVLYDLAWSAYSVGKVAEAENAMRSALHSRTNFSRTQAANQFLDMVHLVGDPAALSQATARIQDALKADAGYVPALMAAALAWERRGDYAEAKTLYEQVLKRYPQFTPATRNLAILYTNHLDDNQKGYEMASKARRALPDDVELTRAMGKLAYRRGEYQYAAQLLKEVEQKQAADAETYFYLGLTQSRLKQKAESTASLRQALAMNLNTKLAEEAKRVLAEQK
jgi:tetratricopeptide (TPR) repeat protein